MKKVITLTIGLTFISILIFSQVSFYYSNFKAETSGLTLLEDAEIYNGILRLSQAQPDQKGACWYTAKTVDPKAAFKCQFTFRMSKYSGSGADGLAFIMMDARQPITIGAGGGGMGYHLIKACVVFEFDNFYNAEWADPDGNHISIHSNGPFANSIHHDFALATYSPLYSFEDGNPHQVTIDYYNHIMRVYFDKILNPVLSINIDIDALLKLNNGPVWVGLTASTGGQMADHDILNWSFVQVESQLMEKADSSNQIISIFEVYPNPFSSNVYISYSISETSHVKLELQNIKRQVIKSIIDKNYDPGKYQLMIDGSALEKGIYFCVLKTNEGVQTKKMIKL